MGEKLADSLTIVPWYLPPLGAVDPPLAKENKLTIGCGDNQRSVVLGHRPDRDYDFLYFKIFITQEQTDFRFFRQWGLSPTEDTVRGMA
jgi:hypothetical protein